MSIKRSTDLPELERDPDGMPRCRWCKKRLDSKRRRWCSQVCVDEYKIRSDPGFVRHKLRVRDKEVCQSCSLDCKKAARVLFQHRGYVPLGVKCIHGWSAGPRQRAYRLFARITGRAQLKISHRQTLWDADHIKPVVEGGGECTLENYRTLCVWCHKQETTDLAKRRAKQRRETEIDGED